VQVHRGPCNLINATRHLFLARYKTCTAAVRARASHLRFEYHGERHLLYTSLNPNFPPTARPQRRRHRVVRCLRDQRAAPRADPSRRDVHRELQTPTAADLPAADPLGTRLPDLVVLRKRQADIASVRRPGFARHLQPGRPGGTEFTSLGAGAARVGGCELTCPAGPCSPTTSAVRHPYALTCVPRLLSSTTGRPAILCIPSPRSVGAWLVHNAKRGVTALMSPIWAAA